MSIEEIAEKLARAMGHHPLMCRKNVTPCTCGAGEEQAEAIDLYEHWKRDKEKSNGKIS